MLVAEGWVFDSYENAGRGVSIQFTEGEEEVPFPIRGSALSMKVSSSAEKKGSILFSRSAVEARSIQPRRLATE